MYDLVQTSILPYYTLFRKIIEMLGCLCNGQGVGAGRVGLRNRALLGLGRVWRTCLIARMAETDIQEKIRNTTSSFNSVNVATAILTENDKI